jgi:hypothetical protein
VSGRPTWPAPEDGSPPRPIRSAAQSRVVNIAGTAVVLAIAATFVIAALALAIKFWVWVL